MKAGIETRSRPAEINLRLSFLCRNYHSCAEPLRLSGTFFYRAVKKSEGVVGARTFYFIRGFQFRKHLQRPLKRSKDRRDP